jgi:hypothetical protein
MTRGRGKRTCPARRLRRRRILRQHGVPEPPRARPRSRSSVSASTPATSPASAKRPASTASAASARPTKSSHSDAAALAANPPRPGLCARAVPERVRSSNWRREQESVRARTARSRSKFPWRVQCERGANMASGASARPEALTGGGAGHACPLTRLCAHRGHGRVLALGRTSHATRRICGRPDLTFKNEVRNIGFRCDGSLTTCV